MDLRMSDFQSVIDRHNSFDFARWRNLFAQHADSLAGHFLTYSGTAHFSREAVRDLMATGGRFSGDMQHVFDPWNGWWTGTWSNGRTQYHIWDPTVMHQGQAVQLVSQSESDFAHMDNMATMRSSGQQVDLAINVASGRNGITGWVSKAREELPHVGYSLNPVTLLWITESGGRYFMFFEWVDSGTGRYGIHGRPFTISGGVFAGSTEQHYGTYKSAPRKR